MHMPKPEKPTRQEIQAAYGKTVPDVIAPGLRVLFCGINPGLFSGAVGHHFARPGNRFWPTLYAAGFSPRLLAPWEERELLNLGWGITNLVERATAGANELATQELVEGRHRLEAKVRRYRPAFVAILGIGVYRRAFQQRQATIGRQPEGVAGSGLWVLPNPSGLNAHYQLEDLAQMYRELRSAMEND
jgi:TDG/mug DNA glycosylase family protein